MRVRLLVLLLCLAPAAAAQALINPNFTPVNLVRDADTILLLEFGKANAEGVSTAVVKKVLKGKCDAKSVKVDFQAGAYEDQGNAMAAIVGEGGHEGMLFIGSLDPDGQGAQDGQLSAGYIDLGGKWVSVTSEDEQAWDMVKIDAHMLGTWAGSTDMLVRAVAYILANPDAATFRVTEGTTWAKPVKVATLTGKVSAANVVDLEGGALTLHVACADGDRLYQWDGKQYADVTAWHKLAAASLASTWGDFDGDGRQDLASFDGKTLHIFVQKADGTFAAQPVDAPDALKNGCWGLTTVGCALPGRAALVVSTNAAPVVLPRQNITGKWNTVVLGPAPAAELGQAGPVLAADLDGDALTDILQLFAAGSLFYKGTPFGHFAAPVPTAIRMGEGAGGASVGDFDGDGLLDVVVTSESANSFWQNRGAGKFEESVSYCGEVGYIAKPGACGSMVGDFNNDGLQDFVILYTNRAPHLFFNRGFRCFGHARAMDPEITNALPGADKGEQAGALADLNGDGALDMAVVLGGGDLWVFPRAVDNPPALCLKVALNKPATCAGPLNVTVSRSGRILGTWVLRAGGSPALVGTEEAGPMVVRWCLPGGKEQRKEVLIVDRPARLALDGN